MGNLFKLWRIWFKRQKWSLKWFLWLILLMPIISMFYGLKGEGALSPLQITGAISFVLCIFYSLQREVKLKSYEIFLIIFGALLVFNTIVFLLFDFSFANFGFVLRTILPISFYFYLRRAIKNRNDFDGILFTYLVSSIVPYLILLYEFFFDPIKEIFVQEARGGFMRLSGFYADLFSYVAYVIGDFIIIIYFIIRKKINLNTTQLFILLICTIIGILGVSHQASWGVFSVLILLTLFFLRGTNASKKFITILVFGLILGGGILIDKIITPLFSKEINAYSGESDSDKALNGRIIRWEKYFDIWGDLPTINHVFGVGFSGIEETKSMMSGGMHSDYVRFLFATGVTGLFCYLLFYISLFALNKNLERPEKFLLFSTLIVMLMYAMTANPFGSSGALIYLTLSSFAFLALGKKKIYEQKNQN